MAADLTAVLREARQLIEGGRPDDALVKLGALPTDSFSADDWVAVGRLFRDAGRRDAARTAGRRALDLSPRHAGAVDLMATPYLIEGEEHSVPLIGAMPHRWERLGWGLVAAGLLATVALAVGGAFKVGANPQDLRPAATPQAFAIWAFYIAVCVSSAFWLMFDLIDRRQRLFWFLLVPATCLCGVGWLPTAIWLGVRKSMRPPSAT